MTSADLPYGPNSPHVVVLIEQARELTADQFAALDSAEASLHGEMTAAWIALRQATSAEPWRALRMAAGNDAWDALATSAQRAGISLPAARRETDGDDWDGSTRAGMGAARAAQGGAAAIVAPPEVPPSVNWILMRPWGDVVGYGSPGWWADQVASRTPFSVVDIETLQLVDLVVGDVEQLRKAAWLAPIGSEVELAAAMQAAGQRRALRLIQKRLYGDWPPLATLSGGQELATDESASSRLVKRAMFIEVCLRVLGLERVEDLDVPGRQTRAPADAGATLDRP